MGRVLSQTALSRPWIDLAYQSVFPVRYFVSAKADRKLGSTRIRSIHSRLGAGWKQWDLLVAEGMVACCAGELCHEVEIQRRYFPHGSTFPVSPCSVSILQRYQPLLSMNCKE